MGLAGQAGDAPPGDHTLCSTPARDGDGVDHLILPEHSIDGDGLLKVLVGKVHLLSHIGASVHLCTCSGRSEASQRTMPQSPPCLYISNALAPPFACADAVECQKP